MDIISSIDNCNIVKVIDDNQIAYDIFLCDSELFKLSQSNNFTVATSKTKIFKLNTVIKTSISQENFKDLIFEKINDMNKLKHSYLWKVWASTTPNEISEVLTNQNFTKSQPKPCMALDINEALFNELNDDNLDLILVNNSEKLNEWISILASSFKMNDDIYRRYKHMFECTGFNLPVKYYVCYLEGFPIATGALFYQGGSVGIYWISTAQKHRNRGVGKSVLLALLKEAYDDGYRVAVLQSSSIGYELYKKIGFEKHSECHLFTKNTDRN